MSKVRKICVPDNEYSALFQVYITAEQLVDFHSRDTMDDETLRGYFFRKVGQLKACVDAYNEEREKNGR